MGFRTTLHTLLLLLLLFLLLSGFFSGHFCYWITVTKTQYFLVLFQVVLLYRTKQSLNSDRKELSLINCVVLHGKIYSH